MNFIGFLPKFSQKCFHARHNRSAARPAGLYGICQGSLILTDYVEKWLNQSTFRRPVELSVQFTNISEKHMMRNKSCGSRARRENYDDGFPINQLQMAILERELISLVCAIVISVAKAPTSLHHREMDFSCGFY